MTFRRCISSSAICRPKCGALLIICVPSTTRRATGTVRCSSRIFTLWNEKKPLRKAVFFAAYDLEMPFQLYGGSAGFDTGFQAAVCLVAVAELVVPVLVANPHPQGVLLVEGHFTHVSHQGGADQHFRLGADARVVVTLGAGVVGKALELQRH